ncbi:hypothetical protein DFP72DRAFT_884119 [Ephemerocybe angulata]|uniref:F-box domain-containing protein n=1 Tax=Ephemerocybe angulata TaxID=980116 RepID=A0A8H6I6E3_9AGAR|nr:hypothetical protein DFP72DRAFT_884119 [Tulosesus angulatus]
MSSEAALGGPRDCGDIPKPVFSADTQQILDEDIGKDLTAQEFKVQHRILELEHEISALKSRQNILRCPLNRILPPELLLRIFLLHPASAGKSKRIHLSHVCRQWRCIALESGAFWADLLFTTTEMTKLMLSRSNEALLTARCDKLDWHHREILATILLHRDRLHTLEISGPKDILLLPPSKPGSQTAPFLQSLTLTNLSIPVWKSLPLGPSITELRLDCPKVTGRPTSQELFGSLSEMPLLRILHLSHLLPKEASRQSGTKLTKQPLSLANLRELRLRDLLPRVNHFFASVGISYSAAVFIDFKDAATTIESLDEFLEVLGVSWSLGGYETCRWDDEESGIQEISIENFNRVHSIHRPSIALSFAVDTVPNLTVSFIKNNDNGTDAATFLAVLDKKVNLTQTLLQANINSCDDLRNDDFWDQLGSYCMEDITFMKSQAYEDFFIRSVMVAEGSAFTGDADEVVLPEEFFPSLSSISLVQCDLTQGPTDRGGLTAIADYLETRTDASNTIVTLGIDECRNLDEERFHRIAGPYPKTKVDWDYDEDMSEDELDSDEPSYSDKYYRY